jgi:hypothetical protein
MTQEERKDTGTFPEQSYPLPKQITGRTTSLSGIRAVLARQSTRNAAIGQDAGDSGVPFCRKWLKPILN